MIDLPADTLRRRIASGRVYSVDQQGGALAEYFRVSNLEALSRLGRAWLTGTVAETGAALLAERGLDGQPPRPVIVAGVSGSPWGEAVIRRAVALACDADADLVVVHANIADGTPPSAHSLLPHYRELAANMGGTYLEVDGESVGRALAEIARSSRAASVVVASHRSRLGSLLRGSVAGQLRRRLPGIPVEEVHDRV
jgi:two-component system sensor histidine kinase KdpD